MLDIYYYSDILFYYIEYVITGRIRERLVPDQAYMRITYFCLILV